MKKAQKIGVVQLLEFIPEALLANLSNKTNVDYYTKVLHGQKMFYLLLYGIEEEEKRLSQHNFKRYL